MTNCNTNARYSRTHANDLRTSLVHSALQTGEYYNLRIRIDAEAGEGSNWLLRDPLSCNPHPKSKAVKLCSCRRRYSLDFMNSLTKGSNQYNPPKVSSEWRMITTYCGAKFRKNQSIALLLSISCHENSSQEKHITVIIRTIQLRILLGRVLEPWEVCRHGEGGNCDHSKKNLSTGCQEIILLTVLSTDQIPTTEESNRQSID